MVHGWPEATTARKFILTNEQNVIDPPTSQRTIGHCCQFLESFAPLRLAADWDNVGLLVGDRDLPLGRIMTCLTITPESAAEAIAGGASLVVSHHPLPFRPLQRVTTDATPSRLIWDLVRAGIAIYSPHTAFDSAAKGINQSLAYRLGLSEIEPLIPRVDDPDQLGEGRVGQLGADSADRSLNEFVAKLKTSFGLSGVSVVGDLQADVNRVGIACGSGGSFISQARRRGCDTFVTGEATFHGCLEAKAAGISLVLMGHYASERFAVEQLADELRTWTSSAGAPEDMTADVDAGSVWASQAEADPIQRL